MKKSAKYNRDNIPSQYYGNPLIECLPEIRDRDEVADLLIRRPAIKMGESRKLPAHIRTHEVGEIEQLYIPRTELLTFENELGIILRRSLKRRNPFAPETVNYLFNIKDDMRRAMEGQRAFHDPTVGAIIMHALSGSGKTRGVRTVLSMYPQVIEHTQYQGQMFNQTQVVWLSVDAPTNGSLKGLLVKLFLAMDEALEKVGQESYAAQYIANAVTPIDTMIAHFSQIAATHFLGVLHIDDLQRLSEANSEKQKVILAFIIQLANTGKIPLVLTGTHKMAKILAPSLEAARRAAACGQIDLEKPMDHHDEFFRSLVDSLLKYQWLDQTLQASENLYKKLYDWTQGIPAILILLYICGQKIALRKKSDALDISHIELAYKSLGVLHPALNSLSTNDASAQMHYDDLLPSKEQMEKVIAEISIQSKNADTAWLASRVRETVYD